MCVYVLIKPLRLYSIIRCACKYICMCILLICVSLLKACHQMVAGARKVLERQCPGVKIEVEEVQETRESAFGNSSGIM